MLEIISKPIVPEAYELLSEGKLIHLTDLSWNSDEGCWCKLLYMQLDQTAGKDQFFARKKNK